VDTCARGVHAALQTPAGFREASSVARQGFAGDAASLVAGLFRDSGLAAADLFALGVTIGPGSYTGVRVGLAFVRGLALVDRVPVAGISSLELLALSTPDGGEERIVPVLDAGQDKVYLAIYRRCEAGLEQNGAPRLVARSEIGDVLTGEPVTIVHCESETPLRCDQSQFAAPANRTGLLAGWAARRVAEGAGMPAAALLPLYVGASHAQPNRNKVLVSDDIE
jgi:tRNA threonylcarbamoyladenosine biosynthesis protein TsaB